MSQSVPNVQALFTTAVQEGALEAGAAAVLNIPDLGPQIQAGLGVHVDDVQAGEVVLVTILLDDSSSISSEGNEAVVRGGCNLIMDSLEGSKQSDSVLICVRQLNGPVIMPYTMLADAVRISDRNYNPSGCTPLYDQTVITLGMVLAKTQEFQDGGCAARSVTLIATDGADYGSKRHAPRDVKKVVKGMNESHIVAFMGIDDGHTDFRKVAADMGIDPKWVLTPGNTPSDIRKAFAVFSQSAVRASQCAATFSQTASGGFTS
jgi:hypothetical protein